VHEVLSPRLSHHHIRLPHDVLLGGYEAGRLGVVVFLGGVLGGDDEIVPNLLCECVCACVCVCVRVCVRVCVCVCVCVCVRV